MHPFETAGLGKAPFVCEGMTDMGPDRNEGKACDYCGMWLRYVYHIASSDRRMFIVGCDCVLKTTESGDSLRSAVAKIRNEFRKAVKAEARKQQRIEAQKRIDEEKAERLASWTREVSDAFAIRDYVFSQAEKDDSRDTYRETFFQSLRYSINRFGCLSERQTEAVRKIMARPAKVSKHIGTIGKREVFNLTCVYTNAFESAYGYVYMKTFEDSDGNVVVYKGSRDYNITKGAKVTLKATIKDHSIYRDVPQTVLARPADVTVNGVREY